MRQFLIALLAALGLGMAALPRGATADEPSRQEEEAAAADFADAVLAVAQTIHDEYVIEIPTGQLVAWAIRGLYQRLGMGRDMPVELEERFREMRGLENQNLRALLVEVRKEVGQSPAPYKKVSSDRFLDLALEAMMRHLDDGTSIHYGGHRLFDREDSSPVGVGLRLSRDPSSGGIRVVTPILGGPAYREGIRAGDLLTRITVLDGEDGKPLEKPRAIPTRGLRLDMALRHLVGARKTRVRLTVERPGGEGAREYTLVRAPVEGEGLLGRRRKEDDRWDYWTDVERKIAYVRISFFAEDTGEELKKVLEALQKEKPAGLVLDLRFNPGGWLTSAAEVADLLIDDGVIATIRNPRSGHELSYRGKHEGSYLDFPVVCLVNGESGGGSEIVAACLQDHGRAVLMGERTAGGGSVHDTMLPHGKMSQTALFIVTDGLYYRPSGKKLSRLEIPGSDPDEWGVTPERKYLLRLPPREQQELAEHLDRQTYLWPRGQGGPRKEPDFKDRQLEMALDYLRAHAGRP